MSEQNCHTSPRTIAALLEAVERIERRLDEADKRFEAHRHNLSPDKIGVQGGVTDRPIPSDSDAVLRMVQENQG